MKHNPSPLTPDLIAALVAAAVLWLSRLMGVLLSPRASSHRRALHRLVQTAERWVEETIFIMAGHRLGSLARKRRRIHSCVYAIAGFRIARGDNRLLFKSARIRLRGGALVDRVQRLFAALADPQRYIARYMKRLARGLCFRRLIATAPAAAALGQPAPCVIAFADSS